MESLDYGATLRALRRLAPTAVVDSLASVAQGAGAVDLALYLVDFEQTVLLPVPDRAAHVELPVAQPVASGPAGEAFNRRCLVTEPGPTGCVVWVPVLEGSDCTGVLGLQLRGDPDEVIRRRCEELGLLAGVAVAIAARYTDLYNLVRRRKAMSLPASLQWDLLPPLQLETPGATSCGVLEPAYDVGGDCFDHALNGSYLDVAVMDAMGHGLRSSALSSLALGTYRHDRREGQPLRVMYEHLDETICDQYDGDGFVTGQIGRLDLGDGHLEWINAGHPAPLLVRRGEVREIDTTPSLPWGLGGQLHEVAHERLEPGDSVVFYTDGVTEGRAGDGTTFGFERFRRSVEQAAASRAPSDSAVRELIGDVLAHQDSRLRDDATILWVTWDPAHPGAG